MELVYLWVEEYKNIKEQGFHFSPGFDCHYDKDKKEVVVKRKENVQNMFDENNIINITAIIGRNGSGKSTLLKCLNEIFRIENNKNKNLVADYDHTFDFILIVDIEGTTYEIKNKGNRDSNNLKEKINILMDDYIYVNDINERTLSNRFFLDNQSISKKMVYDYSKSETFSLSSYMYLPNRISIQLVDFNEKFSDLISNEKMHPMYRHEPDWVYLQRTGEEINNDNEFFRGLNDEYHRFLIICLLQKQGSSALINQDKEALKDELENVISEDDFKKYFLDVEQNMITIKKEKIINELSPQERKFYIEDYSDFFVFNFFDEKNRDFQSLSHGEKMLFGQLLSIYHYICTSKAQSLVFLFDEPEISLHPRWQQRYIYELQSLFLKLDKQVHFLFASHSPFLLSDIPKQNIVFLDRNEKGECIVVDGLHDKEETFGANIHTLLSDGFFMGENLMGLYAHDKIKKIIKFHHDLKEDHQSSRDFKKEYQTKKNQFKFIQKAIGDQYLASVIQNHIDEIEKTIYAEQYIEEYKDNEIKKLLAQFEDEEIRRLLDKHK